MKYIFLALLVILSGLTVLNYFKESSYQSAKVGLVYATSTSDNTEIYSAELAKKIIKASEGAFSSDSGKKLAINYFVRLANDLTDIKTKTDLYCKAFNLVSEIKKSNPYDSAVITNWLNWQQVLQSSDCAVELTKDEKLKLIQSATKNNPNNSEIAYSLALLHIWDNERKKALPYFNTVLKLSNSVSAGQQGTILENLKEAEDLNVVLPARFPQIITWSRTLKNEKNDLFLEGANALEEIQLKAIEQSISEKVSNKITARIHLNNLFGLLAFTASNKVRQTLDIEISRVVGEKSVLGEYLLKRSGLMEVASKNAYILNDTLSTKTSFSNWGENSSVALDFNHTSIGFYKNFGQKIKLVEINAGSNISKLNSLFFEIAISSDNVNWEPVDWKIEQVNNANWRGGLLYFIPKKSDFKYLKISYKDNGRVGSLSNYLDRLIRVYN
jgi:hypothetical protein